MLCGMRGSDWWWLVVGSGDEVMMMRWRHDGVKGWERDGRVCENGLRAVMGENEVK